MIWALIEWNVYEKDFVFPDAKPIA